MEQSNPSSTQQPVYDDNSQQQPPRFHETPGFVHPGTLRRQQPQATAHLSYDAAVTAGPSNARAGEDSSQSLDYSQGFRYDPGIGNIPRQQYIQTTSDLERVQLQQQQQQSQQYGSNAEYSIMQGQLQPQEQTYQSTFGHLQQYGPQSDLRYGTPSGPLSDSRTTQYYTGVQPDPSTAMSADYASQPREVSHFRAPTYAPGDPVSSQSTQDIMLDTRQQTPYQPYGYHQHTTIAPAPPHVKQKQAVQQQVDEKELTTYVTNIRTVFAHVRDRRLREVPELLRMTTRFLAKSFQALGLARDEASQHDRKLKFWTEFNRSWLTTMQCQFDMVRQMRIGQTLPAEQSILDHPTLEDLSRELIKLCDRLQRLGLVDYQMGVAESEIIDIILRCLDQLEVVTDEDVTMAGAEM